VGLAKTTAQLGACRRRSGLHSISKLTRSVELLSPAGTPKGNEKALPIFLNSTDNISIFYQPYLASVRRQESGGRRQEAEGRREERL